jgi:hypothetical protein
MNKKFNTQRQSEQRNITEGGKEMQRAKGREEKGEKISIRIVRETRKSRR